MYIKRGYKVEVIYVNRKVIIYVLGNLINIIKVSVYYNIVKIFENENDFEEVLNYYKFVKELKENIVYDNVIIRVKSKM